MIKTRIFPESNYKSIWFNGKTLRLAIDNSKPITELEFPEFYDVKITDKCNGKCPWCYMDSLPDAKHAEDAINKINEFFGKLSENEKPFQVAIGGGEPTEHPDFIEILSTFKGLGIEPNYTTNGMWIDWNKTDRDHLLNKTKVYCGGVAVSCHPHLINYWTEAAKMYYNWHIKLNFHIIISDKKSIDYFKKIYDEWKDKVDYFVLLPYGVQGRAKEKQINWEYLVEVMPEDQKSIAFGANFYPYLQKPGHGIKVSLYEPEIMSKYLDLLDLSVHKSSFNLNQ